MLKDATPTTRDWKPADAETSAETLKLRVLELSDEDTVASSSDSEPQTDANTSTKSSDAHLPATSSPPSVAPPTKILFLDGIRGLAAMLVVVQHSGEFVPELHLGSVAVDAFFILSSFLLTWLFMKKSMKLLAQGAGVRVWTLTLADYFQKRFFRVYPLFAITAFVLWRLPPEDQQRYFIVGNPSEVSLFKMLTFDFPQRYFVFWTLPLEIAYYFVIPVFVLAVLKMGRFWWVPAAPLFMWAVHQGWTVIRNSHESMNHHLHTFVLGSLGAVVFVKLDLLIKRTGFKFRVWHLVLVRAAEGMIIVLMLSVIFRGLLFHWIMANPAPPPSGFPFVSVYMTLIIVIEVMQPSWVSSMLEWNVLRYWGKISFSIYLLHTFVVHNPSISRQSNYFDRFFARLFLITALATVSYWLVEYPSQLAARRISRFLAAREKSGSGGLVRFTWRRSA